MVCFGGGGFVFICGQLAVSGEISPPLCFEGQGFTLPKRKQLHQPTKIEFEKVCLCPAVHKAPGLVSSGAIWGPCASQSTDTPSESLSRAGLGCPRKGSTASGRPLNKQPPPSHFSVDDLIELCLFVTGATEHVLEAINYRNVAISKRTLGTR